MRCNDCDHQAVHQFQVGVHSQPAHLQATVRRLYSMCRSQEKAAVDTVRRLHGTVRRLPCFSRGTLDPRCRRLWPPVGGGGPAGHAPPGRAQPPTSPPGAFSSARGGLARRRGGGGAPGLGGGPLQGLHRSVSGSSGPASAPCLLHMGAGAVGADISYWARGGSLAPTYSRATVTRPARARARAGIRHGLGGHAPMWCGNLICPFGLLCPPLLVFLGPPPMKVMPVPVWLHSLPPSLLGFRVRPLRWWRSLSPVLRAFSLPLVGGADEVVTSGVFGDGLGWVWVWFRLFWGIDPGWVWFRVVVGGLLMGQTVPDQSMLSTPVLPNLNFLRSRDFYRPIDVCVL